MSRNKESTKEITINDRIKLIRKIHILKLADKVNVSDIKRDPNQKSISEIFAEKECWRCGKIGKLELCPECKDFLSAKPKLEKPEMEKNPEVDIRGMMKELFIRTSLFVVFTREDVLMEKISDELYMNNFLRYIREAISLGVVDKINMKGMSQYRLTPKGVTEFEMLCNTH